MPKTSKKLHRVRAARNDEFYTQFEDVKKECDHYLAHFFDKIVYCNCDTADSAFVRYFSALKAFGLVRDVWFSGGLGGLDFRSPAAISMLEQADMVITNPPFSLFREYMDLLFQYNKKFLVIGNFNAVKYKNIFPLIVANKLWIGTRPFGGAISMIFDVPDERQLVESGKHYVMVGGKAKAQIPGTWFTNLHHNKQKPLVLSKTYYGNEALYPKYDNFDAINVNRKTNIPCDYYGIMGVPITFIDRYNPKQFSILGLDKDFTYDGRSAVLGGRNLYGRIFIRRVCTG